MEILGLDIPTKKREIADAFVKSSYASVTRFLRENYSYKFTGPEGSTNNLLIGTWSKQVRRSEVLNHGTLQDIAKLATSTPRNRRKRGFERSAGVRRKINRH